MHQEYLNNMKQDNLILRKLKLMAIKDLRRAIIVEKTSGLPNKFKVKGLKNVSYRRRTFKAI